MRNIVNPGVIVPPLPEKKKREKETDRYTYREGEKRVGYGNSIDLLSTKDWKKVCCEIDYPLSLSNAYIWWKYITMLWGLSYCLNFSVKSQREVFDSFPGKDFYSVRRTMNIWPIQLCSKKLTAFS